MQLHTHGCQSHPDIPLLPPCATEVRGRPWPVTNGPGTAFELSAGLVRQVPGEGPAQGEGPSTLQPFTIFERHSPASHSQVLQEEKNRVDEAQTTGLANQTINGGSKTRGGPRVTGELGWPPCAGPSTARGACPSPAHPPHQCPQMSHPAVVTENDDGVTTKTCVAEAPGASARTRQGLGGLLNPNPGPGVGKAGWTSQLLARVQITHPGNSVSPNLPKVPSGWRLLPA